MKKILFLIIILSVLIADSKSQYSLNIEGPETICSKDTFKYELTTSCDCQNSYLNSNIWLVEGGQIVDKFKNTTVIFVVWDTIQNPKSVSVNLSGLSDPNCHCSDFIANLNVNYIVNPELTISNLNKSQICPKESLVLSTTLTNNPNNLKPKFEYCLSPNNNKFYSINKPSGNTVTLNSQDIEAIDPNHLGKNIYFRAYVLVCGIKKVESLLSGPVRFLNSPFVENVDITEISPTCAGNKDGKIIINSMKINGNVYDENNPYSPSEDTIYLFQQGEEDVFITNFKHTIDSLEADSYELTFQMKEGRCATTVQAVIKDPTAIQLIATPKVIQTFENQDYHVSCKNGEDGSATIQSQYLTFPYSLSIKSKSTTTNHTDINDNTYSIENLCHGDYEVKLTDANGCLSSTSFEINVTGKALKMYLNTKDALCYEDTNGTIILNVDKDDCGYPTYVTSISKIGGSETKRHFISNSVVDSFSGLDSADYLVSLTDTLGCTVYDTIKISHPGPLSATFYTSPPICESYHGNLNINATGGTSPYRYQINDTGAYINNANYHLLPGNYLVNMKDKNNCPFADSTQIPNIQNPLNFSFSAISPSCSKNDDGKVILKAYGGTGNYEFNHNSDVKHGDSVLYNNLTQNTEYEFTLRDDSCEISKPVTIPPNPDTVTITSLTTQPLSCNGTQDGQLNVKISQGVPDYLLFVHSTNFSDTVALDSNQFIFTGKSAGKYIVIAQDSKGCTFTSIDTIAEPYSITADWINEPIKCFDENNGFIEAIIKGGNGNYAYTWKNEAGDIVSTDREAKNLRSGIYELRVNDDKECSQSFYHSLEDGPRLRIDTVIVKHATCEKKNNGSVYISVLDNFESYSYQIEYLETTENTILEGNSDFYYGNLVAGNYLLHISAGACDTSVVFTVKSGNIVASIDSLNHPKCYDDKNGYLKLTASNDVKTAENYKFHWNNTTTDENYSGHMNEFNILSGGQYYAFASDLTNQCFSDTVHFNLAQPSSIAIISEILDTAACAFGTGEISINSTGGFHPYIFEITQKDHGFSIQRHKNEISPGYYYVNITDSNQCVKTDTFLMPFTKKPQVVIEKIRDFTCDIYPALVHVKSPKSAMYKVKLNNKEYGYAANGDTLKIQSPGINMLSFINPDGCYIDTTVYISIINQLNIEKTVIPASCNLSNGKIELTVTGGFPNNSDKPYQFNWNHTANQTNIRENLSAGIYNVTVSDETGCVYHESIILNNGKGPHLDTIITQPTYCNLKLGKAEIKLKEGTKPFTYNWYDENLDRIAKNSNTATNLSAGKYMVKIVDANNCELNLAINIKEDRSLYTKYTKTLKDSADCGASNGSAMVTSYSKSASIIWNSDSPGSQVQYLSGNTFASFEIVDTNGCKLVDSIFIPQKSEPTLILENAIDAYCNLKNGSLSVSSMNGTKPFVYHWSYDSLNHSSFANNLQPGTYWVFARDRNGCTSDTGFVNLMEYPSFESSLSELIPPTCSYSNDAIVTVNVGKAFLPVNIRWNNHEVLNSTRLDSMFKGYKQVIIEDAKSCRDTLEFNISAPDELKLNKNFITDPVCYLGSTGKIDVWAEGGTKPYQYKWFNGHNQKTIQNLQAGIYSVIVHDKHGCKDTATFTLNQPDPLNIFGIKKKYTICEGMQKVVSPIFPWDKYYWYQGETLLDTSDFYILKQEGNYSLIATNEVGCPAEFQFESIIKNDLLNAEFLINSYGVIYDTITLIDITWPEADDVEWLIPDGIEILQSVNHYCQIIPKEAGVFNIAMRVKKGGCEDTQEKMVTIYDNKSEEEQGNLPVDDPGIEKINIHPNPNDGHFNINIRFPGETHFSLEIINLSTSTLYHQGQFSGKSEYDISMSLPHLMQGVYAIKILTDVELYTYLMVKI
jgi:hypothetical protein